MRPSPQRHTLAVLRNVIGITQKELAQLLECSVPTIQAIELGKLRLSPKLAEKALLATGISSNWLLADDTQREPATRGGAPYTKDSFEKHRVEAVKGRTRDVDHILQLQLAKNILCLLDYANRRDRRILCLMKLEKAVADIARQEARSDQEFQRMLYPATALKTLDDLPTLADLINPYFLPLTPKEIDAAITRPVPPAVREALDSLERRTYGRKLPALPARSSSQPVGRKPARHKKSPQ